DTKAPRAGCPPAWHRRRSWAPGPSSAWGSPPCSFSFHSSLANAFHCRAQVFQRLEVAVDRGETDVGDLVKAAELLHNQLADLAGRYFGRATPEERGLDLVHQRLDRSGRDGPAVTRRGHAPQQFVAAVFLAASIL